MEPVAIMYLPEVEPAGMCRPGWPEWSAGSAGQQQRADGVVAEQRGSLAQGMELRALLRGRRSQRLNPCDQGPRVDGVDRDTELTKRRSQWLSGGGRRRAPRRR